MCLYEYHSRIILCFLILLEIILVCFVYGLPPYDNRDLRGMKLDPMRMKISDSTRYKHVLRTVSALRDHTIANETVTLSSPRYKKWQVGRVSRKQYEIINMLWRKTQGFVDFDTQTSPINKYHPKQSLLKSTPRFNTGLTTTPSFIEFYYLDDTADILKGATPKTSLSNDEGMQRPRSNNKMKNGFREYPIFTFHVDSNYVPLAIPIRHTRLNDNARHNIGAFHPGIGHVNSPIILSNQFFHHENTPQEYVKNFIKTYFTTKDMKFSRTPQNIFDNETCAVTTMSENKETITNMTFANSQNSIEIKPTIAYDRIKFFELYDKNTPLVYDEKIKYSDIDDVDQVINGNRINHVQNFLLKHVDQDIEAQVGKKIKAKHSKKHIIEVRMNDTNSLSTFKKIANTSPSNVTSEKQSNFTSTTLIKFLVSDSNTTMLPLNASSKIAEWADFSFMAVYIFEPSQVHCDAAGISPHWLVTSGSCLSRHHKNPGGEGRSAFVAYCGSFWWTADRVAYVKYSVVHPSFHQRDTKRRHMYNIGLVQVVVSMDTCPGWTPITLMSHRYLTDPEGSVAHAVGWGLDRYSTRYSTADLPKLPLMKFESKVYSDSCPGNYGYLQVIRLHEGGGVKNLYCMSLPPYAGEATDPIHGSMLIVGGKLCAIYLQEERRLSGEQSGIYTGIWRLGPWVTYVAREPEDADSFRIDI